MMDAGAPAPKRDAEDAPAIPPELRPAIDKFDRRKLFYHPRAVADLLETGDCWPVTVSTGFTTYCNHSCVWCSSAYTTRTIPNLKSRDELIVPETLWVDAMRILADNGTRGLIIAGQGEPLLHPKAAEMLDAVAGMGLNYMLFSNGERMGKRFHDSLLTASVAIRLSVDAATPEMHRRWHAAKSANGRGHADFERVVRNIANLVAEKRRRGQARPDIGVQMICSPLTEDDFEGFARLFRDIGVDYVVYKSLQRNDATEDIAVSSLDLHASEAERADQARRMLATLTEIQRRYQTDSFTVHIKVDQIETAYVRRFNQGARYRRCRAHPLTPMIEPDGKVYLCIDHGGNPEFVIGNIYDDPIDAIWASERRRQVIERIDLNRCPAGCFLDHSNLILDQLANPDPALHHVLI